MELERPSDVTRLADILNKVIESAPCVWLLIVLAKGNFVTRNLTNCLTPHPPPTHPSPPTHAAGLWRAGIKNTPGVECARRDRVWDTCQGSCLNLLIDSCYLASALRGYLRKLERSRQNLVRCCQRERD